VRVTLGLTWGEDVRQGEGRFLRLLDFLVGENVRILKADPEIPLLYDSGVFYERERDELWLDVLELLIQGFEDCDGLCAYRTAEIQAHGWRALRQGDPGFRAAMKHRPRRIRAEPMLVTNTAPGRPGVYHCVSRYRINRRWYVDDPSARLGMNGGTIDPFVLGRWRSQRRVA